MNNDIKPVDLNVFSSTEKHLHTHLLKWLNQSDSKLPSLYYWNCNFQSHTFRHVFKGCAQSVLTEKWGAPCFLFFLHSKIRYISHLVQPTVIIKKCNFVRNLRLFIAVLFKLLWMGMLTRSNCPFSGHSRGTEIPDLCYPDSTRICSGNQKIPALFTR